MNFIEYKIEGIFSSYSCSTSMIFIGTYFLRELYLIHASCQGNKVVKRDKSANPESLLQ